MTVSRGRGAVINISSLTALSACPLLAVYTGTKAFVAQFSRDLEYEYRRKGVTIQCVAPGYVVSKLSKLRRATFWSPTADVFVKSALSKLGVDSFTCGYWFHDLMNIGTR